MVTRTHMAMALSVLRLPSPVKAAPVELLTLPRGRTGRSTILLLVMRQQVGFAGGMHTGQAASEGDQA